MLGIDMKTAIKTNSDKCLPYPKLQHAISYPVPRRKILLHIHAVLFDCFDIYRPTCVVPDNGVLLPPQKLSLTIIANETQPPTF